MIRTFVHSLLYSSKPHESSWSVANSILNILIFWASPVSRPGYIWVNFYNPLPWWHSVKYLEAGSKQSTWHMALSNLFRRLSCQNFNGHDPLHNADGDYWFLLYLMKLTPVNLWTIEQVLATKHLSVSHCNLVVKVHPVFRREEEGDRKSVQVPILWKPSPRLLWGDMPRFGLSGNHWVLNFLSHFHRVFSEDKNFHSPHCWCSTTCTGPESTWLASWYSPGQSSTPRDDLTATSLALRWVMRDSQGYSRQWKFIDCYHWHAISRRGPYDATRCGEDIAALRPFRGIIARK